jgi:radical SAM superfamily enzyme YgiQ (UPF0313 family)
MLQEHNVVLKNPLQVDIRFASCYPNLYRTAISSLGYHIIYDFLNSREDTWCERVVYPYSRSLESSTPLKSFDIVSFSLQYEQDYFNVVEMLKKGGLNPRKDGRNQDDPLVIAGGPCATSNPAPMADFIDLFVIGEAEAVMDQLLDKYLELDNPRKELEEFLDIEGVYLPDHPAKRVIVNDMDQACHPIHQIVPETDDKNLKPALGSSFLLGVSRGCTRGCRFCMAGYLYRPRRETSLKKLFKIAEEGREATGLNKIALIGAAVSDYSKIDELCSGLLEMDFKVTTPSLRIESVSADTLESLMKSGLKTITLAPESVFCVRKSLNKPISDEKTFEVVKEALNFDLNVKMYFLVGSPTETQENILELTELMKNLWNLSKKRNSVRFSVNPLIPKPHTPLQWEGYDFKLMKSKIKFLKSNLKKIPLKIESPRTGLIQHVLSNGSSEISPMIEKSLINKIPLKEWEKFASPKDIEAKLPWNNIDVGLKDDFLKKEYFKLIKGVETPWCEEFGCYNCGTCLKKDK